jgi:hypothetical protein
MQGLFWARLISHPLTNDPQFKQDFQYFEFLLLYFLSWFNTLSVLESQLANNHFVRIFKDIHLPTPISDVISTNVLTNSTLGLPEKTGSVNGTDITWDKYPKMNKKQCIDKNEKTKLKI